MKAAMTAKANIKNTSPVNIFLPICSSFLSIICMNPDQAFSFLRPSIYFL